MQNSPDDAKAESSNIVILVITNNKLFLTSRPACLCVNSNIQNILPFSCQFQDMKYKIPK